jgi:DNA-binding transcriptional ArsR family regulator
MLEAIIENSLKEKILIALMFWDNVYARDLASRFSAHLLSVQNQLKKLEKGGVLASQLKGRTRLYSFNPRYAFLNEWKALLKKIILFIPEKEKKQFYTPRLRPRRAGKPL